MASITLVSDLTLETATDASISNPSGGTDIVSITWDSAVEISSYSRVYTPYVPSARTPIPALTLESADNAHLARGRSTVTRYGQIFPRTVYGN
jgi:hypothetical protein